VPEAAPEQVLLKVYACGIYCTDLHIVDGELPEPKPPLIPGNQIVGTMVGIGDRVERYKKGEIDRATVLVVDEEQD
jgi:propanol-preferring alcohol dehydrogenase